MLSTSEKEPRLMNISRATITTLLLSFIISVYIFILGIDPTTSWSAFLVHILPIVGILVVAAAVVVAARATMVTCIMVLVLLEISGKHRKVVIYQGRKIVKDVAMYLVKVVVRERGVLAMVCATCVSLMAMVQARET